ncbi:MAG: DUF481 domain-containing protein [Gammaproteobacteria bacterium]
MTRKSIYLLLVAGSLPQLAGAADAPAPAAPPPPAGTDDAPANPVKWKLSAEAGAVVTTGNSKSSTYNGKFRAIRTQGPWKQDFKLSSLAATQDDSTTAKRTESSYKIDYNFSRHNYVYGLLGLLSDRFSGYDYRYSESVGYGHRLLNDQRTQLDVELGAGARQSFLTDDTRQDEAIARAATKFVYRFPTGAKFEQDLSAEAGRYNTAAQSVSSLKVKLNGYLSMNLSYTVNHNTNPPDDLKKTDSITTLNLVYDFPGNEE